MRSIVIPLLIGLRSSFRSQAELQVEIVALHQQLAVLRRRESQRRTQETGASALIEST